MKCEKCGHELEVLKRTEGDRLIVTTYECPYCRRRRVVSDEVKA